MVFQKGLNSNLAHFPSMCLKIVKKICLDFKTWHCIFRLPEKLCGGGGAGGVWALLLQLVQEQAAVDEAILGAAAAECAVSAHQALPLVLLLAHQTRHVHFIPAALAGHVAVRAGTGGQPPLRFGRCDSPPRLWVSFNTLNNLSIYFKCYWKR